MTPRPGRVRAGRRPPRATSKKKPEFQYKPLPAPNNGLVLNQNLAEMPERSAVVLNNAMPTTSGVRVRGGSLTVATIGAFAVESLFSYRSGAIQKKFAAGGGGVYDITSVVDADTPPTAEFTGQTSNEYSAVQSSNSGGEYVHIFNGMDAPRYFDGSTWTTLAITGTTQNELSQGFSYRQRLMLIRSGTLKFAYLPVDAIDGAAAEFELSGVFEKGGELVCGSTWSQDAGDGLDDKAVFVTNFGEVAIYEGSNPGDVNDWRLVGRYDIAPPLGKNAFTHAGGDLVIATELGLVPISRAVRLETSVLSLEAISNPIEPLWLDEVAQRSLAWQIVEVPQLNMGLITLPSSGNLPAKCLVVNLRTSRWGVYLGWDARSVLEFNGDGFFGTNDGKIKQMEVGGSDDGQPYLFQCAYAYTDCGLGGLTFTAKMGRSIFRSNANFIPAVSASKDYDALFPASPAAGPDTGVESRWDFGNWDEALWDGGESQIVKSKWESIGVTGHSITPQVQALIGNTANPNAELISLNISYVVGGLHH